MLNMFYNYQIHFEKRSIHSKFTRFHEMHGINLFYISITWLAAVVLMRYPMFLGAHLVFTDAPCGRDIALTCIEKLADAHSLGGVCAIRVQT